MELRLCWQSLKPKHLDHLFPFYQLQKTIRGTDQIDEKIPKSF